MANDASDKLLRPKDVTRLLGLSRARVRQLDEHLVPLIRVLPSGCIRRLYRPEAVRAYREARDFARGVYR